MELTLDAAALAWARAWNSRDPRPLEPLIAEDVLYVSDLAGMIEGRDDLLRFLAARAAAQAEGRAAPVLAELGWTPYSPEQDNPEEPCVLLCLGEAREPRAVVVFVLEEDRIAQVESSTVSPDPRTARRSGVFPGL